MPVFITPDPVELYGTVKLTYDEFQRIPYDGLGHHLVNGVHVVTPAPSVTHQQIISRVFKHLVNYVEDNKLGSVLPLPVDVKFSKTDGYQPDLLFIDNSRSEIIEERFVEGPPTLIIEVTSPESSRSDYGWKRDIAEKYKVAEYWVIDRTYKVVEVFNLTHAIKRTFALGDRIQSFLPMLENFVLNTKEIFVG